VVFFPTYGREKQGLDDATLVGLILLYNRTFIHGYFLHDFKLSNLGIQLEVL
jgi:hypothetical protein